MALAFNFLKVAAILAMGVSTASAECGARAGPCAGAGPGADGESLESPMGAQLAGRATTAPPQLGTTGASRGSTSAPPHLGTTGRTHGSGLDTGVGSGAGSTSQRGGRGK